MSFASKKTPIFKILKKKQKNQAGCVPVPADGDVPLGFLRSKQPDHGIPTYVHDVLIKNGKIIKKTRTLILVLGHSSLPKCDGPPKFI